MAMKICIWHICTSLYYSHTAQMSTLMQSSGSQSGRNCPLFDGQGGEKAKGLMGDKTTQQVKNSQPLNVIDH